MHQDDLRLVQVTPSPRQLRQQHMELYAFVHFTVNTFTDKEWGNRKNYDLVLNSSVLGYDKCIELITAAILPPLMPINGWMPCAQRT